MPQRNSRQEETEVVPAKTDVAKLLPQPGQGRVSNSPNDPTLIERLKKSGLDPQKLLDLATSSKTTRSSTKQRHRLILVGYILFVAIPSILFSAYMFFWASDQYHSTAAFAIRSSNSTAATEILGMVLDGGSESTTSNSYIVNDFLQSQTIVEEMDAVIDLSKVFSRDEADWLFRMGDELPIEEKLSYWKSMVDVNFDATSGVIYVDVRTFNAADSVAIAREILNRSERLVNELSEVNRRQSVRFAEETVARAEARLKAISRQLLAYRDETQEVSPEDNVRIAMEMIASLDQAVAAKTAEKKTLETYLSADSPRIRLLTEELNALRAQIANERQRLGVGSVEENRGNIGNGNRLALRIANYSELKLEEEFAAQFYTTALAGLEKSRQDADQKHMYLATFIEPTLSQQAQYPNRFLYSLSVLLVLGGIWTVAVLMYYNIRDRT
ncbi:RkpR, polysaccharide export protein [Roseibium sp. SCPC15]|uniref:RkpR, polysaccharide export protein n=1 Tax=Roseibium sp. SCP15 TaxID=3141376 RepID=UPI00333A0983